MRIRKAILLSLLYCICINKSVLTILAANAEDDWEQSEDLILKLLPELPVLSDKHPNDLEIQLGIVGLYFRYGIPVSEEQQSSEDYVLEQNQKFLAQCNKVFSIDPNNKPALAIFSKKICSGFCAVRNSNMDQLKRLITKAKERNSKEIEIFPGTSLRKYFSEEDACVIGKLPYGKPVVYSLLVNDFNLATQQLREKLDEEFSTVLVQINDAQNKDSENAFYNYLKAALFFEIGDKDKAVKEIEEGILNKYSNSYQGELAIAMNKVLREAGMPQNLLDFLLGVRSPFEDFVTQTIWYGGLSNLGKEYEVNGNIKDAEYIYKLTIKMAKQIQKEQIHGPLNLDKTAQLRIDELSSIENSKQKIEIITQNKSSTKNPLGVALPIAGVAVAVIAIAGLFLIARKKNPNKSE